jgi:hypothetical protein
MTADQRERRGPFAVWLTIGILLLPVAYVLSAGPVILLWKSGYVGDWVYWFYTPLKHLHQNSPAAAQFLDWYLELWRAT